MCVRMWMHIIHVVILYRPSLREARIDVCCVKELLTDNTDLLTSGSDGFSFSFLSHITITKPEGMLTSHTHL